MKKRLLATLLCLCTLLTLLPAAAWAAEHGHNGVAFTAWTTPNALPTTAGNYYLDTDVTLNNYWNASSDVHLCLNGHTITQTAANTQVIWISNGATLTLYDCGSGSITGGTNSGVYVGAGKSAGTFCLNGGAISGNSGYIDGDSTYGGGVYVVNGSFIMNGGLIKSNTATYGGGVYIRQGSSEMNGGEITGNTAASTGGGMYVQSGADFTVTGGTIHSNTAAYGGGAGVGGAFTMRGGELRDNTATKTGGGAYVSTSGEVTLGGGLVKGAVHLLAGRTIAVTAALPTGTAIALSTATAPTADAPTQAVLGSGYTLTGDDLTAFSSLDPSYFPALNANVIALKKPPAHTHAVSVGCETGSGTQVSFQALAADTVEISASGSYYLAGDLALENRDGIAIEGTEDSPTVVDLCLNGHKLSATRTILRVGQYVTLNICDCDGSGGSHTFTSPVTGSEVTVSGGLLTGVSGSNSRAIKLDGDVNLYGGTIAGNGALDANFLYNGMVYCSGGTFHMYGGAITHNATGYNGGGIATQMGHVILEGGSLTDNAVGGENQTGGGVYLYGGPDSPGLLTVYSGFTLSGNKAGLNGGGQGTDCNVTIALDDYSKGYIRLIGNRPKAPIGVSIDGDPGVFTQGFGTRSLEACFVSEQTRGVFLTTQGEAENAEAKLEPYAITTQPTAASPAVALNHETGATYSWHTLTEVLVDDTVGAPYEAYGSSSSYADGFWTGMVTGSGGAMSYCDLTLEAGDTLVFTLADQDNSGMGRIWLYGEQDYSVDASSGEPIAIQVGETGEYTLAAMDAWGSPKLKVVKTTMSGALDGQTTATLTAAAPGAYACRVEWGDGTVLISDTVTITSPSHAHAVSVDCSASEGTQVTFSALGDSTTLTAGSYYLDSDKTLTAPLTVPTGVTVDLCLNGHALKYAGTDKASVIKVNPGGTLNLCDCDGSGGSHIITSPLTNEDVTISGGLITGGTGSKVSNTIPNANTQGGGICVEGSNAENTSAITILNVYGGTVAGNTAYFGGGLAAGNLTSRPTSDQPNVSVNLFGGRICHNSIPSTGKGGGVFLDGYGSDYPVVFTMAGNSRVADNRGQGICVFNSDKAILRENAAVTGNQDFTWAGGVYLGFTGSLTMGDNAQVTGNVGGGVCTLRGNVTVSGNARIWGNTDAPDLKLGSWTTTSSDWSIRVGGPLGQEAKFGVAFYDAKERRAITSGGGGAYRDRFVSQMDGCFFQVKDDGELWATDYAITQQPTPEAPTVEVNYAPDGLAYQWYPVTFQTAAIVLDTESSSKAAEGPTFGAEPYETEHTPSTFEDGKWTASRRLGKGGYFQLSKEMAPGGHVTVTFPTADAPSGGFLLLDGYSSETEENVAAWYAFDGSSPLPEVDELEGYFYFTRAVPATAVQEGENTVVTFPIDLAGDSFALALTDLPEDETTGDYATAPVISATLTAAEMGEALANETGPTLATNAVGSYLCKVTWPDETKLTSRLVTFTAPSHIHAMSVDCEATGDNLATFDKALTVDGDGKLCVDGASLGNNTLSTGHYYLAGDVNVTLPDWSYLYIGQDADVDLCLNGYTLNLDIVVNGQLRLCDCSADKTGAIVGSDSQDLIQVTGDFALYGGTVKNTSEGEYATAIATRFGGAATLYGGQVIAKHGNALRHDYTADALTLYDGVSLQGGADSTEVCLDDIVDFVGTEGYTASVITIAQPLTAPETPWRVSSFQNQVFTDDWAEHMADKNFNDYFTCVDQGRFIEKTGSGELAVADYAITAQPTAQAPTVAVNYAPQGVGYQWYPATVSKKTVATEDSDTCVRAEPYEYITGSIAPAAYENGKWTAAQSSESLEAAYFTVELQKGDKVTLTLDQLPTEGQLGLYAYGKGQLWYYFGGNLEPDKGVSIDGSVITYVIPTDGSYKLTLDGLGADETAPVLSAQLTRVTLDEAVSGQTAATLAGVAKGDYLCRVTWPDGTVIDSDVVTYTPPHVHDWGKWILQADKKTLTRVCAGNAGHTQSEPLSYGLPNNPIVYNGTEKKPAPSLKTDGDIGALTGGTDYTVSYRDNVNAGTATAVVTGTGNFSFTLEMTFTIQKADQAAPAGIFDIHDAPYGQTVGAIAIKGDASTLEYRAKPLDGSDPAWITAAASNALSAGTYEFRYKSTDNYNASPATEVQVRILTPDAKSLTIDPAIEHGTVEKRRDTVNPGDTVTLAVTPDDGYTLASITATYGDGQTITPTVKPDNAQQYTFTMPNADVTVTATFAPVPPEGDVTGEVVLKGDAPRVTVDQDALKELAGEVAEGDTVTVKLTVEKQDTPTDKDDIQAVVTGKKDDVLYLDFSLLKQVNDGVPEAITDTRDNVLEIKVPYDFTGKKDVSVYRKHGDTRAEALAKLAARPAGDFQDGLFYADRAGGAVYIYASKFSTYAIAYTAETTTPSGGGSVGGYVPPTVVYPPDKTQLPFTDVKTTDACYESVKYVYEKGWMLGTSDTTFDPNGQLTRAMLATVLYRMAGSPEVEGALAFEDTLADTWYSDAVLWAAQTKTLRGYGNGSFGPDDPVSKEMVNVVTARRQGEDPAWVGDPALAIPATRAEVAQMLMTQGADEN